MFRVVCRSFGQLRCTDSCLIDSTGCKYFTWAGKWTEKKLARMQLCNFSSFWSLGSHFRFLLKPHPYKTNWWTEERVLQGSSCACSEPWEVTGVSSEWTISPGALSLFLASGSSFLLLSLHRLQHCYEHWRWRRTCNDCTIWNIVVVYDLLTVDAEISYVLNFL